MQTGREIVFETYISNAFGAHEQSAAKIAEFEFNYARVLPKDLQSHVLEIGTGRGEMLSLLKSLGYENYRGVDISADVVKFCKSLGLPCELAEDTIVYLNAHVQAFDCIMMLDVLEHVEKSRIYDFVTAVNRALKSSGVFIVQVPNMQAPDPGLHRYNDITHEVGFVEHSLHQLLSATGFAAIEFFPFEVPGAGLRHRSRLILRAAYHRWIRFRRRLNADLNPEILTPVFYAVANKQTGRG